MTMFNKRHYEAIAMVCQDYRRHSNILQTKEMRNVHMREVELRLAEMFQTDNPRFDFDRFMHACQLGSSVKAKTAHLQVAS